MQPPKSTPFFGVGEILEEGEILFRKTSLSLLQSAGYQRLENANKLERSSSVPKSNKNNSSKGRVRRLEPLTKILLIKSINVPISLITINRNLTIQSFVWLSRRNLTLTKRSQGRLSERGIPNITLKVPLIVPLWE